MLLSPHAQTGVAPARVHPALGTCGRGQERLGTAARTEGANVSVSNGRQLSVQASGPHVHKWVRLSTHCVGLSTPGRLRETGGISRDFSPWPVTRCRACLL